MSPAPLAPVARTYVLDRGAVIACPGCQPQDGSRMIPPPPGTVLWACVIGSEHHGKSPCHVCGDRRAVKVGAYVGRTDQGSVLDHYWIVGSVTFFIALVMAPGDPMPRQGIAAWA